MFLSYKHIYSYKEFKPHKGGSRMCVCVCVCCFLCPSHEVPVKPVRNADLSLTLDRKPGGNGAFMSLLCHSVQCVSAVSLP